MYNIMIEIAATQASEWKSRDDLQCTCCLRCELVCVLLLRENNDGQLLKYVGLSVRIQLALFAYFTAKVTHSHVR